MTHPPAGVDRRTIVAGAGGAVVALGLTAACGSSSPPPAAAPAAPASSPSTTATPTPTASAAPTTAPAATPAAPPPRAPAPGVALGKTSAVPVGGGVVFASRKVVVTQPRAGTFVGLSAVCTHQGCVVQGVSGGTINCPCHGSRFHLDGTVAKGPAARALAARRVTVVGGEITLA